MDIGSFLVANAQSAELVEPGKTPLDDPAPSSQSAAMLGVALGKQGQDVAGTQTLPDRLRVITTIA